MPWVIYVILTFLLLLQGGLIGLLVHLVRKQSRIIAIRNKCVEDQARKIRLLNLRLDEKQKQNSIFTGREQWPEVIE